jgi:GNAT superfamily N-acetyltransferase
VDITLVATRADLEDFQSVEAAAMAHDHIGLPADPVESWLPVLEHPERGGERVQLYVARDDRAAVGSVVLKTPLHDNLALVDVEARVHPDHRRRGHGRRLAQHVLAETRALGRTRIITVVASPPDQPPRAARLLAQLGARAVVDDVRRMIDLHERTPVPLGDVPGGYRIVQWDSWAPDELVDGLAYLMGRMSTDAPLGDMDYEPEKWDAARYRETEQSSLERKRRRFATAAVHESGEVAGVTEIAVNEGCPEVGSQWETIVDPKHRGHGLGLVVKSRNHVLLAETLPECRYLNTWNAASNSFMIRVNDALGYRPVESWTEYQLDL